MKRHIVSRAALVVLMAGLSGWGSLVLAQDEKALPPGTVRIGLVRTLFRDVPEPMVRLMMQPFNALMKAQTGMNGELIPCCDPYDLGKRLHEGKMELGVFHGFEFGWAQQKYPDLRPLCIAINRHRNLTANIVVRNDSPTGTFADLKGKVIALPRYLPGQCRLYLQRLCREAGAEPRLFAKITTPANVEEALDDVLRGKLQAAVVDGVSLECYEQVKSACFSRLKVLKQSEIFPAAVVAYREGALDASTLKRFREGMVSASQTERGRDLMSMWKLTGFEDVPANYSTTLANIMRIYPYTPNQESATVSTPSPSQ
jgi:ABC-type phosphate/phosphonate transport system substrate-binding protein